MMGGAPKSVLCRGTWDTRVGSFIDLRMVLPLLASKFGPTKLKTREEKGPMGLWVPPQTKRVECALAQGEGMTINRRWLAREWLFLVGGLFIGMFSNFIPYLRVPLWVPYVLFQIIRITVWAIRTLRETVD